MFSGFHLNLFGSTTPPILDASPHFIYPTIPPDLRVFDGLSEIKSSGSEVRKSPCSTKVGLQQRGRAFASNTPLKRETSPDDVFRPFDLANHVAFMKLEDDGPSNLKSTPSTPSRKPKPTVNATPVRSPLTDQRAFSVSAKREATEFRGTKGSPSAPSTPRDMAYKTPDSKSKTSSTRSPRTSTGLTSSPTQRRVTSPTSFAKHHVITLSPTSTLPELLRRGHDIYFRDDRMTKLKPYQALDLMKLKQRELESRYDPSISKGHILAYYMGLGKTVVTVGLIIDNPPPKTLSEEGITPTTLVVCPSEGLLHHWKDHLDSLSCGKLSVHIYHGQGKTMRPADVILCTLHQVVHQFKVFLQHLKDIGFELPEDGRPPPNYKLTEDDIKILWETAPLLVIHWHRLVLDEAQHIRNPDSKGAIAMITLRALFALVLTGTPMQNKERDIQPQLNLIGVKYMGMDNVEVFDRLVTAPLARANRISAHDCLLGAIRGVVIYRPISLPGLSSPLIELSTRQPDYIILVDLTAKEQVLYDYMSCLPLFGFVIMLRQRQSCLDPRLLLKPLTEQERKLLAIMKPKSVDLAAATASYLEIDDVPLEDDECDDSLEPTTLPSKVSDEAQDYVLNVHLLPKDLQPVADIFDNQYQSTKMIQVLKIVNDVKARGEKTIIFSSFVSLLSLIGDALAERHIGFTSYTGAMSSAQRQMAMKRISQDAQCKVILISIKAGGTGLNITACNHVIIMDPWWNPYVEEQAISRAHRIGQSKDVHVYRILARNTIEERIVEIQNEKRETIEAFLDRAALQTHEGDAHIIT